MVSRSWIFLYRAYLERSTAKILSEAYKTLNTFVPWNLTKSGNLEEMDFPNLILKRENLMVTNGEDALKVKKYVKVRKIKYLLRHSAKFFR